MNATLHRSELWAAATVLRLTDNMRVLRAAGDRSILSKFAKHLLRVGEGREGTDGIITLDPNMCFTIPPPPTRDVRLVMERAAYGEITNWVRPVHTQHYT